MADLRVTQAGVYTELGTGLLSVTQVGVYTELGTGLLSVTQVGVYTELESSSAVLSVTQVGVYTELGTGLLSVTQVGVYTELEASSAELRVTKIDVTVDFAPEADQNQVTQYGVLVEISTDVTRVTQFGVLLEIEEVPIPPVATYFTNPKRDVGYVQLPEAKVGYQLDAGNSFWSVVVPERSKNLFWYPSFEYPFTDETFSLGRVQVTDFNTYEQSHLYASRGYYGLLCYPDGATEGYVSQLFSTDVEGWHTFSFDLWGKATTEYRVDVFVVSGITEGDLLRRVFIQKDKTGQDRYSVTFYVPSTSVALSGSHNYIRCKLVSAATNNVNQFMSTDGWQVEAKTYATTYFDGSSLDDSFVADPNAYTWEGKAHRSPSRRSDSVYNGGRIVSLHDAHFKTTSIVGLGYVAPEANIQALPNGVGYLSEVRETFREFSVIGRLFGCDVPDVPRLKQRLIDLFNHSLRKSGQIVLRYQPVDRYGLHFGRPLSIPCIYQGGLEGNVQDLFSEQIELRFKSTHNRVFEEFNKVEELGGAETVLDNTFVFRNPQTGEYKRIITSMTGTGIYCSVILHNGNIVLGGEFSTLNGVTDLYNVALWRWDTEVIEKIDDYGFNGAVYALECALHPTDGDTVIFAGGAFTQDGLTLGNMRYLAYVMPGNTWSEVGSGLDDTVYDIQLAYNDTTVYVAGSFLNDNSANVCELITSFSMGDLPLSGATFVNYGLNFDAIDTLYSICLLNNGRIVIAGEFIAINGDTNYQTIAEFDPSDSSLTNAYGSTINGVIYKVQTDRHGVLYACGELLGASSIGLVYWTGNSWVDALKTFTGFAVAPKVMSFDFDEENNLHSLLHYRSDGLLFFQSIEIRGNVLVPSHLYTYRVSAGSIPDFQWKRKVTFDLSSKTLMWCLGELGAATTVLTPSYFEVVSQGTAPSSCDFLRENFVSKAVSRLTRVTNWSSGHDLFFASLDIPASDMRYHLSGYKPLLTLGEDRRQVASVLSGASSRNNFVLLPGTNHLHLSNYLAGTVDDKTLMKYIPSHWSIDIAS